MALNMFLVELNNARGHLRNNTRFAAILAGTSVIAGAPLIILYAAPGAAVAKFIAILAGLAFLIFHSREGIAVAMKPVIGKTAILFFSLIAVRLALGDTHWILSNSAALLVVVVELFVLRVYSAEEMGQWKSQIAGLFGKSVVGANHLPDNTQLSDQTDPANTDDVSSPTSVRPANTDDVSSPTSVRPANTDDVSSPTSVRPANTDDVSSPTSVRPDNTDDRPSRSSVRPGNEDVRTEEREDVRTEERKNETTGTGADGPGADNS